VRGSWLVVAMDALDYSVSTTPSDR
jgi:hypothetical protein